MFEKEFGEFIYYQIHYGRYEETQFGVINKNTLYIEKSKFVLKCLCDIEKASIDTFNYSFIDDEEILDKMNFINGSYKEPIFGIDSYFEPDIDRYIFTKTNRRIESEMNNYEYSPNNDFDRVVVFGHSLNEADYGYFFPLFDKIKLLDLTAKGNIVFAYYMWSKEKEDEIKSDLRGRISQMIFKYSVEKGIPNPKRTLDSLSTQKKIITYEIPDYPDRLIYIKCRLDVEWEKQYKEIELILQEMEENK